MAHMGVGSMLFFLIFMVIGLASPIVYLVYTIIVYPGVMDEIRDTITIGILFMLMMGLGTIGLKPQNE